MRASETTVEATAMRKVGRRIVPFLALLYFAAFLDRSNVSFAAPTMNRELGFSAYVYGLGAGIFFIGYVLFEVPSNLILHRVGARRWIARIMMTWAVVAAAMALVNGPFVFYLTRFLLGVAEAGFFPGVIYYLTLWAPAGQRAKIIGLFMTAIAVSTAIGGPLSSAVLSLYGVILWIPQILVAAGVPTGMAGYVTAIPYAIAAVAMVWWCRRSDEARERPWHIAAASAVGAVGLAASGLLAHSPLLAVVAITFGAAGTLAVLPIFWTLPAARLRGAAAAGGIAMINAVGNVGGFVGPYAVGWIKDATGDFTYGLIALAAGVLATGVMALAIGHVAAAEHGEPGAAEGSTA